MITECNIISNLSQMVSPLTYTDINIPNIIFISSGHLHRKRDVFRLTCQMLQKYNISYSTTESTEMLTTKFGNFFFVSDDNINRIRGLLFSHVYYDENISEKTKLYLINQYEYSQQILNKGN